MKKRVVATGVALSTLAVLAGSMVLALGGMMVQPTLR
jgi:hypothetical protein